MEQYKKTLRARTLLLSAGIFTASFLIVIAQFGLFGIEWEEGILSGFQQGLLVGMVLMGSILIIRISKVLKNPAKLEEFRNRDHDERRREIKLKSGGNTMLVSSVVMIIAGIAAGYVDILLFYGIIGCAVFQLTLMAVLKVYHSRKM